MRREERVGSNAAEREIEAMRKMRNVGLTILDIRTFITKMGKGRLLGN